MEVASRNAHAADEAVAFVQRARAREKFVVTHVGRARKPVVAGCAVHRVKGVRTRAVLRITVSGKHVTRWRVVALRRSLAVAALGADEVGETKVVASARSADGLLRKLALVTSASGSRPPRLRGLRDTGAYGLLARVRRVALDRLPLAAELRAHVTGGAWIEVIAGRGRPHGAVTETVLARAFTAVAAITVGGAAGVKRARLAGDWDPRAGSAITHAGATLRIERRLRGRRTTLAMPRCRHALTINALLGLALRGRGLSVAAGPLSICQGSPLTFAHDAHA